MKDNPLLQRTARITYLLEHPEERARRGKEAIGYVKKHYDKEVIKAKFRELFLGDSL